MCGRVNVDALRAVFPEKKGDIGGRIGSRSPDVPQEILTLW